MDVMGLTTDKEDFDAHALVRQAEINNAYAKSLIDSDIAKWIHYPDCWDDMAYPTLASALWEMCKCDGECPTCGKYQGNKRMR